MTGLNDSNSNEPVSKRRKIQLPALPSRPGSGLSKSVRKKTVEACQKCREKRIKCNGKWPCESCCRKGYECSLKSTTQDDHIQLTNVMDQILTRLGRVEEIMQRKPEGFGINEGHDDALIKDGPKISSVTEVNPQTGCFEYYGETSNFFIAKSLARRLQHCADHIYPSSRDQDDAQARVGNWSAETDKLGLHTMLDSYDLVMPHNTAIRRYQTLQKDVADRHLENFFATIHIYFPIFDIPRFRAKYSRLRDLFGSNLLFTSPRENQVQQQSLCLLYAVLALGALYADDDDSSSWASWYFSEAQELLGRLFDAVSLELVQAGMFMGAYAQHALKPSLAYTLAGTATRMAFSIGLNVDSNLTSHDWDAEEGRRTWWMIYIQEVELSVDSGRPMSISKSDIIVDLPKEYGAVGTTSGSDQPHRPTAEFIKALAGVAQITCAILKFVARCGSAIGRKRSSAAQIPSFDDRLNQWRQSLPALLIFEDEDLRRESDTANSWISRQRSSLLVHYNLALIVLHRVSFTKADLLAASHLVKNSQYTCIQAARAIILHVHGLFEAAPCLMRWRYYCYYCLQATLVLLMKVIDEPAAEETKGIVAACQLSISVFRQINLKAAKRCAEIVTQIIERWRRQQDVGEANSEDLWSTFDAPAGATHLEPMPESHDLDLPINDDLWAYFADSEMHSRSFESWLDILNAEDLDKDRTT
ncbi:uncharacterized protein ASPGLDRAFT_59563 [Aspergillus glaucus CBS 516.65]|uniref:Zn(2)-C6 fungal-type domain-containing protein n=1 Tax=Aspergillus glaucus CBS 516.65 TaxID=1160497 RepID=A0A1L9VF96_ASPGL|nr:hypothetical protein ASPGLDRAFT_59563 [Aspergillus glaucus CBS 516.65]OJJ82586.1 hypothetical protein ASPGLDRAFT_59563 [Aspergillus glaucus CBS 516.65]